MLIHALPFMSATDIALVMRLRCCSAVISLCPGGAASWKALANLLMKESNSFERNPYERMARAVKLQSSLSANSLYLLFFALVALSNMISGVFPSLRLVGVHACLTVVSVNDGCSDPGMNCKPSGLSLW